jgi:hypothetical protein
MSVGPRLGHDLAGFLKALQGRHAEDYGGGLWPEGITDRR